jgi:spore coat protein A
VTLDPLLVPKFVNPVPQALDPSFVYQPTGTTQATLQNGTTATVPLYSVGAYQIQENLGLGLTDPATGQPVKTTVYGYGTSAATATYPGRSFVVQSGSPIAVQWTNGITSNTHILPVDPTLLDPADNTANGGQLYTVTPQSVANTAVTGTTQARFVTFPNGVPIATHVHGGHTDAIYDGTPQQWFTNTGLQGADFVNNPFVYDNSQQGGTIWYHDHAMGVTRVNVYAGLAGFYIIHDANENALIANHSLPNEKYDVPLAIQDRMFTVGGQLYYPSDVLKGTTATYPSEHPEFFGDTILVNGQAWPVMDVEPRVYRFRILDGSEARFYNLSLNQLKGPSSVPFSQIGTDDGLLGAPVVLNALLVAPGERADIVIDFSKFAGQTFILTNSAKAPFPGGAPADPATTGQIMMFRVSKPLDPTIPNAVLPATLNTITPIPKAGAVTLDKGLFETTDAFGRLIQYLGTPTGGFAPFGSLANGDQVQLISDPTSPTGMSAIQIWNVYNNTKDVHPIHLHQVSFQILSRQNFNAKVNPLTGVMTNINLNGSVMPPAANEVGWKDTVQMYPGQVTTIIMKFDLAGNYVWHCHILEHEEHDMMHWLVVKPPAAAPAGAVLAAASATALAAPVAAPTGTAAPAARLDDHTAAQTDALIGDPVTPADSSGISQGAVDAVLAEFAQWPPESPQ